MLPVGELFVFCFCFFLPSQAFTSAFCKEMEEGIEKTSGQRNKSKKAPSPVGRTAGLLFVNFIRVTLKDVGR